MTDVHPARSECPIASTLDLLGDKWTLLVVRDLLDGKRRFSAFEQSPEGIPSSMLADRLKRLVDAGIAERVQVDGSSRSTYVPTTAAWELRRVLLALADWGNDHVSGTWVPPEDYLAPDAGPDEPA